MSSFSITCTTCNCRLAVRDDSLIGQILSCPKCESMVMVEPPTGYVPSETDDAPPAAPSTSGPGAGGAITGSAGAGEGVSDSVFGNQETVDDLDAPLHKQRKLPRAAPAPARDETAEMPEIVGPPAPPSSKAGKVFRAVDDDPMLPTSQWVSPTSQRNRRRLLIAVSGLGGLLLLILVIALAIRGGGSNVAQSGGGEEPKNEADQDPSGKGQSDKTDGQKSKDADVAKDKKDGTIEKKADAQDQTKKDSAKSNDQGTKKNGEETSKGDVTKDDPTKKTGSDVAKKGDSGNDQAKKDGKAPPGLKADANDATAQDLSKTLKQFAPFLNTQAFDNEPRSAELRTAPPRVAIPRPLPPRIDVRRRLADRMLEIEYKDVALGSFLQDLTALSTIPITLDADALLAHRVSPSTKISVKLVDATVAQALTAALKPLQLGYVVEKTGHLVVTWPVEKGQPERIEGRYEVDDLIAGDDTERIRLTQFVQTLVAPNSWADTAQDGASLTFANQTLVVKQTRLEHFHLQVLLDKLRVARGLAPRSSYGKLAMLSPRTAQVLPKLSKVASFNYRSPVSLQKIVGEIAAAGELDVMIDWRAAAGVGWGPQSESTLVVQDKLVSESFANVLDSMDLTIRVVDPTTVEVTTWKDMASHLEVEAYPVGHVLTPQSAGEWMSKLQERLKATTSTSASRNWAFYLDERSKYLFAKLPQVQQIQLSKVLAPRK